VPTRDLAARSAQFFVGLIGVGLGAALMIDAHVGLSPWDVLHQGISRHTPLEFGQASIVVGVVMLAVAWALGQPPGLGTAANAIVIGTLVDVYRGIGWVGELSTSALGVRVVLLFAGVALFAIGSTFYIGASFGAGPRDSTMLALSRRTGRRIAVVRAAIELTALAVGWLLGGTAGVGTALAALLIGPAVEAGFWLALRVGLAERAPGGVDVPPSVLGPAE